MSPLFSYMRDVRGSRSKHEVDRQLKALNWNGHYYARIRERTKLDLCNNKAEKITAVITLHLGGKVDRASHDGQITLAPYNPADWAHYRGDPAVNNSSIVVWKVTLAPGETFLPSVDHHFYARH